MNGLVDTNILVYAANGDSHFFDQARSFLKEQLQTSNTTYLTWTNLYEFLRVVTHPKVFKKTLTSKQALDFLDPLLALPNVEILEEGEEHLEILKSVLKNLRNPHGNLLHDCHIAAILKEHGVHTIFTHDTDFRLFDFLEVMDPL